MREKFFLDGGSSTMEEWIRELFPGSQTGPNQETSPTPKNREILPHLASRVSELLWTNDHFVSLTLPFQMVMFVVVNLLYPATMLCVCMYR